MDEIEADPKREFVLHGTAGKTGSIPWSFREAISRRRTAHDTNESDTTM